MPSFKEMLCENIYGGHALQAGDIMQLGYDPHVMSWLFVISCFRCGKMSLVDRPTLDSIIFKNKSNPSIHIDDVQEDVDNKDKDDE